MLHQHASFPVGKVDFLDLYPFNFFEFLCAIGQERFAELLKLNDIQMVTSFKTKYMEWLRQYYYVGGMPAAVVAYAEKKDFIEVRAIQKKILDALQQIIAMIAYYKLYVRLRQAEILNKFSPKDIIELSKAICKIKIRGVWNQAEITEKTRKLFAKIGMDYLK